MSWYYNYYIGREKDGKYYPWGVYDAEGKIHPVMTISHSYASDLHRYFHRIPDEMISEPLRKEFESRCWNGDISVNVRYLPIEDLPKGDYIRTGYFLISDVEDYERSKQEDTCFDGFYDRKSPQIYAAMMQKELTFGKNTPVKDIEGEEYTEKNASDYMYYAYPDYTSIEYEAFLLRKAAEMLQNDMDSDTDRYVILMTEG